MSTRYQVAILAPVSQEGEDPWKVVMATPDCPLEFDTIDGLFEWLGRMQAGAPQLQTRILEVTSPYTQAVTHR